MPGRSNIGWLYGGYSWNPMTGCTEVGQECDHCYARVQAEKLQARGAKSYANGFRYTEHPDLLDFPLTVKTPSMFFVASMSDPFHEAASPDFTDHVVDVISRAAQHTFILLTKRPQIAEKYFASRPCPANLWPGTSVGVKASKWRIRHLQNIDCEVRVLSVEPLLERLEFIPAELARIGWVIVGGESGEKFRPMPTGEPQRIRDLCGALNIPFFYKQSAGRFPGMNDELDGQKWKERPETAVERKQAGQATL